MTGTVLLIIRTALAATLYIFLGWALLTLWRDIRRQQKNSVAIKKPPEIKLAIRIGDDLEAIHEKVYQGTEVTLGRDPTCECILSSEAVSSAPCQIFIPPWAMVARRSKIHQRNISEWRSCDNICGNYSWR